MGMEKKLLPMQVVLPRKEDVKKNIANGSKKMLCEFTQQLREDTAKKFENLLSFYENNFEEYPNVPCVGKVIMKDNAIAKSHKPLRLLYEKNCPIIGTGKLNEIFIKLTEEGIKHTINEVLHCETEDLKVNMTKIEKIEPYIEADIVKESDYIKMHDSRFAESKAIKIKLFDYRNIIDNKNCEKGFKALIKELNLHNNIKEVEYSSNLKIYKLYCNDKQKLRKILQYNGVKKLTFFSQCESINNKTSKLESIDLKDIPLPKEGVEYPVIGIIDSGIKAGHKYLEPWIYGREIFVHPDYQNNNHGSFVAGVLEFGHILNNFEKRDTMFKLLDVVALPNSDPEYGMVEKVDEDIFLEIVEKVISKYKNEVKIWNMSLGFNDICDEDCISDIAVALDEIQDKYNVDIIMSSGNYDDPPYRNWPPTQNIHDRITIPADSVRSITVGSIAHIKGCGCVEKGQPSPFSRRGPGANFIVKPELVDYGGNCDNTGNFSDCGIISFDENGNLMKDIGTSFSAPRTTGTYGHIRNSLYNGHSSELAKSVLFHSAQSPLGNKSITQQEAYYVGFGSPNANLEDVLFCDKSSITLIFDTSIYSGTHINMDNFPYPDSLFKDGKWNGEVKMTLFYKPPLDVHNGQEYCCSNIEVSLGTYKYDKKKDKIIFNGQVPLDVKWEEKYEKQRVESGFKWCPVKSYYKKFVKGVEGLGWRLHVECHTRAGIAIASQPFCLIVTIKDPSGSNDIYTETINNLKSRGFVYYDLQVQERLQNKYNN